MKLGPDLAATSGSCGYGYFSTFAAAVVYKGLHLLEDDGEKLSEQLSPHICISIFVYICKL